MAIDLQIFADYCQIHVLDEGSDSDLGEVWTEEALIDRLGVAHDALVIGTEVNVGVAVKVDLLRGEPDDDSSEFDHVVEASLHVPSGRLVVMGCTDYLPEAPRFEAPAGWIRVRASRRNLANAFRADIESDESSETIEQLRLQAWAAPPTAPQIFKRWSQPAA
ncbi:hypothetical protein [Streptomyces sp. H39-C1]|uniref:hypothetical protein n=1 Tax=Streptomyces sp. H39-C1 TaxID=3004355 RepID=UPI0022AF38CD|nr:hypothetical protein [Streptomyces sp. H39-C1]MCZ4103675.1 hypothetical protein [Streptomyces sp. H39-C1]